jgi:hypothetical protein
MLSFDKCFYRHHRYIFEEKENKSRMKEGPKKVVQARLQVREEDITEYLLGPNTFILRRHPRMSLPLQIEEPLRF